MVSSSAFLDVYKRQSIDHLKHRLSGEEGEVYQSNHFADHDYWGCPTWGMQCGSDMQPVAARAFAKLGMNNDAVRPLEFIAKRVCSPYQRGSFPETANERRFAYFSPSAGAFSDGVISGIFGVDINKLTNCMTISPCFPDNWQHAKLQIDVYKRQPLSCLLCSAGRSLLPERWLLFLIPPSNTKTAGRL